MRTEATVSPDLIGRIQQAVTDAGGPAKANVQTIAKQLGVSPDVVQRVAPTLADAIQKVGDYGSRDLSGTGQKPLAVSVAKAFIAADTAKQDLAAKLGASKSASALDKAFGVDLASMTQAEVVEFIRSVGTGERAKIADVDATYVFRLTRDLELDDATMEPLLRSTIDARVAALRDPDLAPDDEFDHAYMIGSAMVHLARLESPTAPGFLVGLLQDMVARGEFRKPDEKSASGPRLGSEITGALLKVEPAKLEPHWKTLGKAFDALQKTSLEPVAVQNLGNLIVRIAAA